MLEQIPPNSIEHFYGPERVSYAEDELVLLCLLRDGRPYLKSFVEHHFSMGVKHIFFLDNGSTDGTIEALKGYENVTVLRTGLPFERYELSMRQYLVERFCQKGRWCLYADMDELFDYPYSDVVSLGALLRYLNDRSYTAVVAQMLDMFPKEPLSDWASNLLDEPLMERHRFYDISNVQRKGIREHRPARNNTYESDDIEAFYSGLRNALFGTRKFLTRFALMFSDGRLKPFAGSGHWVDEARVADLTCVLFHYKFLDGYLRKKAAEGLGDQQHWNTSHYNKYLKALDSNLSLQLKQESARELRSVNDLVENQFLVVSEEYMMLVYHQQHKKGGGHDLRRGGPGGGPQDEAAFERTRAQAKVQSLRAKRLQRRLEQLTDQHQSELQKLREHNQRELQKLREQQQRRIEKLSRRLTRTKKKTKKKNRALMKQLRSIRASRSWRLLNKLARLRAKVLRRNATKQAAP